jgi:hypothetical protein
MTVRSARVQQVIVGDEVTLTHQLVKEAALNAEKTIVPVEFTTGDTVTACYKASPDPLTGEARNDVRQELTSSGTLPQSIGEFTLAAEKTALLLPGLAQTVRIEVLTGESLKSYYLYEELDVLARGFPLASETKALNLP